MTFVVKKWFFRGSVTVGFLLSLLLVIVLIPRLTYARHTTYESYTIYHQQPLDPQLAVRLEQATEQLKTSELYCPGQSFDVCLNDNSFYPALLRQLRGPAFAWGFADKVVLQGTADFAGNYVALNGYRWNATALLAHELTHCVQASALGVWHANPVARLPEWKWEGYAEYISRPHGTTQALQQSLRRLHQSESRNPTAWALSLPDGTIAPVHYARYQVLVQYCLDVKHLTYRQLLADTADEATTRQQLEKWYAQRAE